MKTNYLKHLSILLILTFMISFANQLSAQNKVHQEQMKQMKMKQFNAQHDKTCANIPDLTEEQKANVVVTPQVREEYVNSNEGRDNPQVLDNYSTMNIHKLFSTGHQILESKDSFFSNDYFNIANNLFRGIALKNLVTDFSNEAYADAAEIVERNQD